MLYSPGKSPISHCPGRSKDQCIPPGRGGISEAAPSRSPEPHPSPGPESRTFRLCAGVGAAPGERSPEEGRGLPLAPPTTGRAELGGAYGARGSPAARLPPRAARAPPHSGLKPRGRLVAAQRAPSGARRCESAPAASTMRPAPALALASLCLLALPAAAAAAAYFGSVPVASPHSACPVPG